MIKLIIKDIFEEEEITTEVETEEEIVAFTIGTGIDKDNNPQTVLYAFESDHQILIEEGNLTQEEAIEVFKENYEFKIERNS